jgi:hypothetical protein
MDPEVKQPHIGQSIKLTQGVAVIIRFPIELLGPSDPRAGASNGFYRHLFSTAMHEWLKTNVGHTCGHHLWELEGQGDWLFTGGGWAGIHGGKQMARFLQGFRFRDRRKAAMFKLRWDGRF